MTGARTNLNDTSMRDTSLGRGERGFTIIEVMAASVILLFAIVSVIAVSAHSMRYLADIRRTARSSQVLQQKMEDIRIITDWNVLTGLSGTTFTDPANPGLYNGSVTEANWDTYGGTTNIVLVTLTVSWTNQTHRALSNSLSTLICIGGLNKYIF
jgi:Tfp pilus assembly protein PilE